MFVIAQVLAAKVISRVFKPCEFTANPEQLGLSSSIFLEVVRIWIQLLQLNS